MTTANATVLQYSSTVPEHEPWSCFVGTSTVAVSMCPTCSLYILHYYRYWRMQNRNSYSTYYYSSITNYWSTPSTQQRRTAFEGCKIFLAIRITLVPEMLGCAAQYQRACITQSQLSPCSVLDDSTNVSTTRS